MSEKALQCDFSFSVSRDHVVNETTIVGHVGKNAQMTFVSPGTSLLLKFEKLNYKSSDSEFSLNTYYTINKAITVQLATGSPIDTLFLSDVINVIIDYGKPLSESFRLEIVSCFLVSSPHTFTLITDGTVNQVNDEPLVLY